MTRAAPNRLAREASPYLLQHAHNPVDWWPWGEPAFAEARRRDVPIFLSVGYSTCYWCHVMERESFENESVARALNARFVCVKLDREERPDIDELYMTATQLMTGHGGWPMSVFLEPQRLRPFWCGTYFPPEPRHNLPGFMDVIEGIGDAWATKRDEVMHQAEALADAVASHVAALPEPVPVGADHVQRTLAELLHTFDRAQGGFGGAPKFPQPVFLDLLLQLRSGADDPTRDAIDHALRLTLDRMAVGGLFDQVGGGFHRYCVDATWTVPHFEKMLYDNALLVRTYVRAAATYDDAFYQRVVRRTLDYVLREMTAPEGAFFSAQDAEVHGREGANYTWTPDQVRDALEPDDAKFALAVYALDRGPNFRDPHHPDAEPVTVLRLDDRPDRLAPALGMNERAFLDRLDSINERLLRARAERPQPRLDDKIIAAWNGMMIAALADAHRLTRDDRCLHAARRAADFILNTMTRDGPLLRSWRAGIPGPPGFLEDSAFFIRGLVALSTHDDRYLAPAISLAERALADFADGDALYDARANQSDLFIRPRSTYDGAVPCGSSTMLHAFLDLFDATRDETWRDRAVAALRPLTPAIASSPRAAANSVHALFRLLRAGGHDSPSAESRVIATTNDNTGRPDSPSSQSRVPAQPPVEIFADADHVRLAPGEPAVLNLLIRIAPGWHINAADPGHDALVPLRVHRLSGHGFEVYADYPPGEPSPHDPTLRIHAADFQLPVILERTADLHGRPRLAVTFQPCTDTECLAPTTVELDVTIE